MSGAGLANPRPPVCGLRPWFSRTRAISEVRTCDQLGLSHRRRNQQLARAGRRCRDRWHPRSRSVGTRDPERARVRSGSRTAMVGQGSQACAQPGMVLRAKELACLGRRWCAPLLDNGLRRSGERRAAQPERAGSLAGHCSQRMLSARLDIQSSQIVDAGADPGRKGNRTRPFESVSCV